MKKIFLFLLILILLIIFDKKAAQFGNGVFNLYYPLLYNISLTNIDGVYITNNENEFGSRYIEQNSFYTKDIYVKKILGYNINQNNLNIYVQTPKHSIYFLSFKNKESVKNKEPFTMILSKLPSEITNLEKPPFLYYYWKPIYFICVIFEILLLGTLLLSFIQGRKR